MEAFTGTHRHGVARRRVPTAGNGKQKQTVDLAACAIAASLLNTTETPEEKLTEALTLEGSVLRSYHDEEAEVLYLAHRMNWRFSDVSLFAVLISVLWWFLGFAALLYPHFMGPIVKGSFYLWGGFFLLCAIANHIFCVRRIKEAPNMERATQQKYIRLCELSGVLLVTLATTSFLFVSIDTESSCRDTATTRQEFNFCLNTGLFTAVVMPLFPLGYLRLRSVRCILCIVAATLAYVLARPLVMANIDVRQESSVDRGVFYGYVVFYLLFVVVAAGLQEHQSRKNFEIWVQRERLAGAITYHHERVKRILSTVLPADCLDRISRGEPVSDHREQLYLLASRIHDFSVWSQELLPPLVVSLIDSLHSTFDKMCRKYRCEKLHETGDWYIVAEGLRRQPCLHPISGTIFLAFGMRHVVQNFQPKAAIGTAEARVIHHKVRFSFGLHRGGLRGTLLGTRRLLYHFHGTALDGAVALCRSDHSATGKIFASIQAASGASEHCRLAQQRTADLLISPSGATITLTYGSLIQKKRCLSSGLPINENEDSTTSEGTATPGTGGGNASTDNQRQPEGEGEGSSLNMFPADFVDMAYSDEEAENDAERQDAQRRTHFLEEQGRQWERKHEEQQARAANGTGDTHSRRNDVRPPISLDTGTSSTESDDGSRSAVPFQQEEEEYRTLKQLLADGSPVFRWTGEYSAIESMYWAETAARAQEEHLDVVDCTYCITVVIIALNAVTEEATTVLSSALLIVAFCLSLTHWGLRRWLRLRPPVVVEWFFTLLLCLIIVIADFSLRPMLLNGGPHWLQAQLSMCLLLVVHERAPWIVPALVSVLIGVVGLVTSQADWLAPSGGTGMILIAFMYMLMAWNREKNMRMRFLDTQLLATLGRSHERKLLWHRGVLHMLMPAFVVALAAEKPYGANCVSLFLQECVMLDIRLKPRFSSTGFNPAFNSGLSSGSGSNNDALFFSPPTGVVTSPLVSSTASSTTSSTPQSGGSQEKGIGAALRHHFRVVESLLPSVADSELVGILFVLGDTMRLGGPLLQPELPDGPRLFASFVEMQRFARKGLSTYGVSLDSIKSAVVLLSFLEKFVRVCGEGTSCTACLVCESGYMSVLGTAQPTFAIVGVVERMMNALMEAAPQGFLGMTSGFKRLLDDGQPTLEPQQSEEEPLPVVNPTAERWRLRGTGYVSLYRLESPSRKGTLVDSDSEK